MSTSGFSKISTKDLESKPSFIETDLKFDTHVRGQNYVAINVAHQQRSMKCQEAAFKIVGTFDNVENATDALSTSLSQGCDGTVGRTHYPMLLSLSVATSDNSETEKVAAILKRCKSEYISSGKKLKKRVDYAKAMSAGDLKRGRVSPNEAPLDKTIESPPVSPLGPLPSAVPAEVSSRSLQPVKNFDASTSNAAVISLVGEDENEPVLIVYAVFKTYEEAKVYVINNLQSETEYNVSIVSTNEWHFSSSFLIKNNNLDHVDYFDKGLSNLMDIPRTSKQKTAELKKHIPESEYVQPVADLKSEQCIQDNPMRKLMTTALS